MWFTWIRAKALLAEAQWFEQIEERDTVILSEIEQENPQHLQILDQALGLCSELVPQGVQIVSDCLNLEEKRNPNMNNVKCLYCKWNIKNDGLCLFYTSLDQSYNCLPFQRYFPVCFPETGPQPPGWGCSASAPLDRHSWCPGWSSGWLSLLESMTHEAPPPQVCASPELCSLMPGTCWKAQSTKIQKIRIYLKVGNTKFVLFIK